jgi:class 3 adenylate cyclase
VIYLENNVTEGAFTNDRVTVLRTLSSQIAVSLENARHYDVMKNLYHSTERFVPKAFLELLKKETIEEIKVGDSAVVNLAPMFADIRNFTTISEAMGVDKTAYLLNAYMKQMTPIIRRHNGFVSQFLGDGIMALFPKHYVDALDAALEMRAALPEFNTMIRDIGFEPIEIGIGIHGGPAMLITLGEEERLDASVVSDVVNSASRIEGLNKIYGTGLLISDAVYNSINNPSRYLIRVVDKVRVKGREQPLSIYEVLLKTKDNDKSDHMQQYFNEFTTGFNAYESGDFVTAGNIFIKCLKQNPDDKLAHILKKRCDEFIKSGAPVGWDGTYTALEK